MSLARNFVFFLSENEAAACRRLADSQYPRSTPGYSPSALALNDEAHMKNVARRLADQFYGVAGAHQTSCCIPR